MPSEQSFIYASSSRNSFFIFASFMVATFIALCIVGYKHNRLDTGTVFPLFACYVVVIAFQIRSHFKLQRLLFNEISISSEGISLVRDGNLENYKWTDIDSAEYFERNDIDGKVMNNRPGIRIKSNSHKIVVYHFLQGYRDFCKEIAKQIKIREIEENN